MKNNIYRIIKAHLLKKADEEHILGGDVFQLPREDKKRLIEKLEQHRERLTYEQKDLLEQLREEIVKKVYKQQPEEKKDWSTVVSAYRNKQLSREQMIELILEDFEKDFRGDKQYLEQFTRSELLGFADVTYMKPEEFVLFMTCPAVRKILSPEEIINRSKTYGKTKVLSLGLLRDSGLVDSKFVRSVAEPLATFDKFLGDRFRELGILE
jgi:hypothetical protein